MPPLSLMLTPIPFGWAVMLSDGRELCRFHGPGARQRAQRYLDDPHPGALSPSR